MSITRRQFELGIDPRMDRWMREVYQFLAENKENAFSLSELRDRFDEVWADSMELFMFTQAMTTLVKVHAIEQRTVGSVDYYSWEHEMDVEGWEVMLPPV